MRYLRSRFEFKNNTAFINFCFLKWHYIGDDLKSLNTPRLRCFAFGFPLLDLTGNAAG